MALALVVQELLVLSFKGLLLEVLINRVLLVAFTSCS
jgi:hypothetical protein